MEKLFEYYIENDLIHVKYAKGMPARRDTEFHDYSEFVYFINGNSFFISKNLQQKLSSKSVIMIPQENYHQFVVRDAENYTRCILGFRKSSEIGRLADEVMNGIKIISQPDKSITDIFDGLAEIMASNFNDDDKLIFAKASLMQLLVRIKQNAPDIRDSVPDTLVSRAIDIIDARYSEKLSVDLLAGLLYVSPSTLSHKFKEELNISVYRYVTKKRLSAAHGIISQGESITSASAKCGFSDYSCFYRLYKKYYGNI